ncbi:MAG: response regulator [Desulfuromonas sp.]|nr:MAG: response regulator [Desulfuromonas sp.]
MRTLIVEDDLISRRLLQKLLAPFGECHVATNGREAVEAFSLAMVEREPYDLICLDIMLPEMDGQEALKTLRRIESEMGVSPSDEVKVFMTTALDSMKNVMEAYYRGGCTAYLVKPIEKEKLYATLREYKLIAEDSP